MFAKGIGHRSHLRKVFLIVVVFVLAFFTIEIIVSLSLVRCRERVRP